MSFYNAPLVSSYFIVFTLILNIYLHIWNLYIQWYICIANGKFALFYTIRAAPLATFDFSDVRFLHSVTPEKCVTIYFAGHTNGTISEPWLSIYCSLRGDPRSHRKFVDVHACGHLCNFHSGELSPFIYQVDFCSSKYSLHRVHDLKPKYVLAVYHILVNLMIIHILSRSLIYLQVNMGGTLYFWGLTIDTVTSVMLILAIGLAIDYSAHVGHTFMTINGTRNGI